MTVINPPLIRHMHIPLSNVRSVPARLYMFHLLGVFARVDPKNGHLRHAPSVQGIARVGQGGDGIADARSTSSGSRFMLLTLPVPLRCDTRSGLLKP
jgi:hypothetical protein